MDEIKIDYEVIQELVKLIQNRCDDLNTLYKEILDFLESLRKDGFVGAGATAFFTEMDGEVMPSFRRFCEAWCESATVLGRVASLFQQAEEEAKNQIVINAD